MNQVWGNNELKTNYGYNNVPDASGRFLRNSGGLAAGIGQQQSDELKSHFHSYLLGRTTQSFGGGSSTDASANNRGIPILSTSATGGSETRPKNLTVNIFVKVKAQYNL